VLVRMLPRARGLVKGEWGGRQRSRTRKSNHPVIPRAPVCPGVLRERGRASSDESGAQSPSRLQWIGPAVYLAFVVLMITVDYVSPTGFRSPPRYGILVPYLVLFFGLYEEVLAEPERPLGFREKNSSVAGSTLPHLVQVLVSVGGSMP